MPYRLSILTISYTVILQVIGVIGYAGGIRGTITADDGSPLAYATIFVKQSGTGTVTGQEGQYEVFLSPGHYDITFQYLGYETVTRQVEIADQFIEINLTLKSQAIVLQNVIITAGNEDPAYTIMRKAISKAKFHTQQIDAYSAKVYIKGKGKLKDYPWLAKKALEKEGV
ncbi:MAG TPA: membrane receptor RagA, partial [Cytophagales bacterium]|nr:membrane receptor RagA [Cytophagales bacterium]